MTLTYLIKDGKVLLGLKKQGLGIGRYNGFGGKVEKGETIEETAEREIFEECGLTVKNLVELGVLNFSWAGKNDIFEVHIFKTTDFSGEIEESEEMRPEWFSVDKMPYNKMWASDIHWWPLLLNDKKFNGHFIWDKHDKIVEYDLKEV